MAMEAKARYRGGGGGGGGEAVQSFIRSGIGEPSRPDSAEAHASQDPRHACCVLAG